MGKGDAGDRAAHGQVTVVTQWAVDWAVATVNRGQARTRAAGRSLWR